MLLYDIEQGFWYKKTEFAFFIPEKRIFFIEKNINYKKKWDKKVIKEFLIPLF